MLTKKIERKRERITESSHSTNFKMGENLLPVDEEGKK